MLKIDSRTAVLVTLVGFAVTLTGLAFLLVSAWIQGVVITLLGLAVITFGYRSVAE
ncbi:hypothetical protein [Aeromicrobium wangtongii]|uniref:Uncharacterized protein n=1 Tax=Aeromicrobium wangtongii TaxID=2969247 RepID=A0ABY5M898_9ACTN|nr:hypothetical protein [Aeromicrobium wangtongii]MCD9198721.1 hypothetical protein [Aeromicrobium wangtongii]MCL3819630.1 hypothetical protein [Aeromicrobium wangtongii]UUP13233.1 hypothetical protein NQV15_15465 [Aeromicrobium wangtongii]